MATATVGRWSFGNRDRTRRRGLAIVSAGMAGVLLYYVAVPAPREAPVSTLAVSGASDTTDLDAPRGAIELRPRLAAVDSGDEALAAARGPIDLVDETASVPVRVVASRSSDDDLALDALRGPDLSTTGVTGTAEDDVFSGLRGRLAVAFESDAEEFAAPRGLDLSEAGLRHISNGGAGGTEE